MSDRIEDAMASIPIEEQRDIILAALEARREAERRALRPRLRWLMRYPRLRKIAYRLRLGRRP